LRENPAKVSNEKSAITFVRGMFFSPFHKKWSFAQSGINEAREYCHLDTGRIK
jgi:hypothetical protein